MSTRINFVLIQGLAKYIEWSVNITDQDAK